MADYDSDSSLDDASFTETSVLLGFALQEPTDDGISQLGGYPTWLDKNTAPSGAFGKCKVCNDYTSLYLQLNGDLPERFPGHERRLYIFGCRRKACRRKAGSIRGIRGSKISKVAEEQKKSASRVSEAPTPQSALPKDIGGALFGNGGLGTLGQNPNPFATGSASVSHNASQSQNPFGNSSNPFAAAPAPAPPSAQPDPSSLATTFAEKVRLSADPPAAAEPTKPRPQAQRPHEPWPSQETLPKPYAKYNLDADYETLEKPSSTIPSNVRIDTEMGDGDGLAGGGGAGAEMDNKGLFESSMDKAFQKFADRIEQNPEQVLRYEFGGVPLLYNDKDAVGKALGAAAHALQSNSKIPTMGKSGMPACEDCGAPRVFELQLMPHAIAELEADEDALEGMDWGTIVLGVCSKDCSPAGTGEGEVGYAEEWIGVQWEELIGSSKR